MPHPIVFIPAADKDAANTALFNLFGEGWETTFGDAQASPTGAEPATEFYAAFPVNNPDFEAVENLWASDFPAGGIYVGAPGQTLATLNAALLERGLERVEPE